MLKERPPTNSTLVGDLSPPPELKPPPKPPDENPLDPNPSELEAGAELPQVSSPLATGAGAAAAAAATGAAGVQRKNERKKK